MRKIIQAWIKEMLPFNIPWRLPEARNNFMEIATGKI